MKYQEKREHRGISKTYLEKRMNTTKFDKISFDLRENAKFSNIEDLKIPSNLPLMSRIGSRKNTRSNIRNVKYSNIIPENKPRSQRRGIPIINPMILHQPEFHRSGIVQGKQYNMEGMIEKNSSFEAERILQFG